MRSGRGYQRWPSGKVYDGEWKNHVYHGQGSIYKSVDDHAEGHATPIYVGEWAKGLRNGHGRLTFNQDVSARPGKGGIDKQYVGQFKDDLFNGAGTLERLGAVPKVANKLSRLKGFAPSPKLRPDQLILFRGQFRSDWYETFQVLLEADATFKDMYGSHPHKDLKLAEARDFTKSKEK